MKNRDLSVYMSSPSELLGQFSYWWYCWTPRNTELILRGSESEHIFSIYAHYKLPKLSTVQSKSTKIGKTMKNGCLKFSGKPYQECHYRFMCIFLRSIVRIIYYQRVTNNVLLSDSSLFQNENYFRFEKVKFWLHMLSYIIYGIPCLYGIPQQAYIYAYMHALRKKLNWIPSTWLKLCGLGASMDASAEGNWSNANGLTCRPTSKGACLHLLLDNVLASPRCMNGLRWADVRLLLYFT